MKTNCKWEHPYTPSEPFSKRVAYFSMEFGIDTALKIYSGGLGYLAGSHMRSAHDLNQNMIGIGMLWKLGYYDQTRDQNGAMKALFRERYYTFLQETDLIFPVTIHGQEVKVQAWYLPPDVFGTVPMYLLTTDRENLNDYLSMTTTHRLYDNNTSARIAQSIVLGVGGAKVAEALGGVDKYHMNEAHALPLAFHLYKELGSVEKVREKLVFTTHTPVRAGNEEHNIHLLNSMDFFGNLSLDTVREITNQQGDSFGYTPAALTLSGNANGVSQLHARVSNDMWKEVKQKPPIIGITNAQNQKYWQDTELKTALDANDNEAYKARKRKMKEDLFAIVADQTGNMFDPDILTIVWARRFAAYKRADLILRDLTRFYEILESSKYPLQVIWAGKPYPQDDYAVDLFNHLVQLTRLSHRSTILTGYEMNLSAALKKGSDIWLNTPRRPMEASGTSGMTAAMNGSVNFSVNDGWIPEFAKHGHNCFILPEADVKQPIHVQDDQDYHHLMRILTSEILPAYYDTPEKWTEISKNSMREVVPFFGSNRMATEYYERLYNAPISNK
ncbi:MAG: alpha-glucan family phosphorylase [Bacteroidetes bacterium]|nr:alpha-glucan family phosphorylase [Bacteroidota bacterium]MCB0844930.1 alpha-glucan family phosphorylase [Bacteroidota bacterium]